MPSPEAPTATAGAAAAPPGFIPAVRAYRGAGYEDFQIRSMRELGVGYIEGLPDFSWAEVEPADDAWKWDAADEQMDALAAAGLRSIAVAAFAPEGLPWDETVPREAPRYAEEFGEFAFEMAGRYHGHPAWSGLVAVESGGPDANDSVYLTADPETTVQLLNAAYDGIKRADPATTVIGFNLPVAAADWEAFHDRALALEPKFDWFGVRSDGIPATWLTDPDGYGGALGLINVRRFLNGHGFADASLWVNGAGFGGGDGQTQAEQVVEAFILARTLGVDLRGWVYADYFTGSRRSDEGADTGLMMPLDEHDPPQARPAWHALQTLVRQVGFFEFDYAATLSGEFNYASPPFVIKFADPNRAEHILWIVFSPPGAFGVEGYVDADLLIDISPAQEVRRIGMMGEEEVLPTDSGGTVEVKSTRSPVYLIAGG